MEEEKSDDDIIARSGESGLYGKSEELDPWSTGEIKHLKTKWLQQELEERVPSDKELEESTLIISTSGRRSYSRRLSSSTRSPPRSLTSSRRHSMDRHENDLRVEEHTISNVSDANLSSRRHSMDIHENDMQMEQRTLSNISDADLSHEVKDKQDKQQELIEYIDILAHLALFGIIGVLIRYGLEVLFDDVLSVTHELTIVYRDLPANIVGSFFMGWVGIVFKEHIRSLSEPLAIGLSTGLMGSITTYAGWNQKMAELLAKGNVAASISGLLLGMSAAATSLIAGIDSAKGLQIIFAKLFPKMNKSGQENPKQFQVKVQHGIARLTATLVIATCTCGAALFLLIGGHSSLDLRILWLAALVGPPGVWLRWHLARFNGRGIFRKFKWLPVGTLLANLLGASLNAILAFLEFVMTNDNAAMVLAGLQLGFVGCLSTVSTFVAEVYTMHVGRNKSRSYTYTFLTLILGLILSIFLYSIPSWKLQYVKW